MTDKPFWIVWCPTGPHSPQVRHDTDGAAIAEAERLARVNPEQQFYVLESVCSRQVTNMVRVNLRPDNMPF